MKNQFLLFTLLAGLTSCASLKKGSSASNDSKPAKPGAAAKKDPVFLENISINSSKTNKQRTSKKVVSSYPALADESTAIPGMSTELSLPLQFKYAILLDVPVEDVSDKKLVEFMDNWYGAPYRYGGNDRNGVDCSAFTMAFLSALYSISIPRVSAEQYRQSKRIKKNDLREGDLVFFKTRGRRYGVSHVGVYLRNNKFIHASTSNGVMINDLDDTYYAQHYAGAGRVR